MSVFSYYTSSKSSTFAQNLKLVDMKKFFLGICLLAVSIFAEAETIKGSVIDTKGTPMPFVTISVLAPDSSLITGAITDDDGKYEIELSAPSGTTPQRLIQNMKNRTFANIQAKKTEKSALSGMPNIRKWLGETHPIC